MSRWFSLHILREPLDFRVPIHLDCSVWISEVNTGLLALHEGIEVLQPQLLLRAHVTELDEKLLQSFVPILVLLLLFAGRLHLGLVVRGMLL